jgi:H+/Cl- antiporter ClcA
MALAAAGVTPADITVSWRRTMTLLLIGLAAAGGLIGVLLSKLFQTRSAWRLRDIGLFVRGALVGVVVYLMYFNLVALLRDPGGNITAFVVGAAAGYVGKAALDRFARRTLAGGDSSKKGQSFRAKTA